MTNALLLVKLNLSPLIPARRFLELKVILKPQTSPLSSPPPPKAPNELIQIPLLAGYG